MNELTYTSESQKQKKYMEEMKVWVKEQSEMLGRPLTCCCKTFGCQMVSHSRNF